MSSFTNLLSRLTNLSEATSPMDRLIPGFQTQARGLATSRGASSSTREGRLAMLTILFELDIIDEGIVRMFKNDPSVSRMVDYFEQNGIASRIKSKRQEIEDYMQSQLENKISFTTGNRTDAAMQRMEMNKLNAELKAAKKVARIERKKDTASALSMVGQVVDSYGDLLGSIAGSYSSEYMIEVLADRGSDLEDIDNIIRYLKKFVQESDIEVEGKSIDATFSKDSKLGRLVSKLGIATVEKQISDDLVNYNGAGVVIHEPDLDKKPNMIGRIGQEEEEYQEEDYEEEYEEETDDMDDTEGLTVDKLNKMGIETTRYTGGRVPKFNTSNITENSVINYMSEQKVYSSPKLVVESQSFREKFKPKTSKQLAELINYGM